MKLRVSLEAGAASPFEQLPCSNGEATEIVCDDVLDRFPPGKLYEVLTHWVSKLAHGASLTIIVVDAKELARGLLEQSLDMQAYNELSHGLNGPPRLAAVTLQDVVSMLQSHGLKVMKKRTVDYRAVVTGLRP